MFTGLIQDIGTITQVAQPPRSRRLTIRTQLDLSQARLGESIAVNGACYTVTDLSPDTFTVDVSVESLARTTTGRLVIGDRVHLERALRMGDPMGGHLVTGHIDGVGRLLRHTGEGISARLEFSAPPEVAELLVPKGSVAVDGVSLTVNEVGRESFSVMIIPHTAEQTRLAALQVGQLVNLEGDLIGKYVAKWLRPSRSATDERLERLLKENGFL